MTTCPRCLFDSTIARIPFDKAGNPMQCEYCDIHDDLEKQSRYFDMEIDQINKCRRKYNCLIGISGGADSSTLLYAAVMEWGLRPLVVHFDNHWNKPVAQQNMKNLIERLNVDAQVHYVDAQQYRAACRAFLVAGLPDADIVNDMVMTKIMYQVAEKYGITYILNGHNFRTEGSTPRAWTYMDAKYIRDVARKHMTSAALGTGGTDPIKTLPLPSMWDQVRWAIKGIKQVRPFHYEDVDYEYLFGRMWKDMDWQTYGGKHAENIYTEFVGAYLLPQKFGIDKRRVYLSAQMRSGVIDRSTALNILAETGSFDLTKMRGEDKFVDGRIGKREDYARYNWKRWKWLVWLMWAVGAVPRTFYVKYCK